jgi:hypothetical protein
MDKPISRFIGMLAATGMYGTWVEQSEDGEFIHCLENCPPGPWPDVYRRKATEEEIERTMEDKKKYEICENCAFWGGTGEFGVCFGPEPADRAARTDTCDDWKPKENNDEQASQTSG